MPKTRIFVSEYSNSDSNNSLETSGYNDITSKDTYQCSSKEDEIQTDYAQTPLYQAFGPLMFSLKLAGLHHIRSTNNKKQVTQRWTVSQIYCWIVTVLCWAMWARSVVTIRVLSGFGSHTVSNLNSVVFSTLSALSATNFLIASHNPKQLQKFFLSMWKLKKYGGMFISPIKTKKHIVVGTILSWIIVITNYGLIGFMAFYSQFFDIQMTDPVSPSDKTLFFTVKLFYYFLVSYFIAVWTFPSTMQLSMAIVISKEFNLFCKSIRSKLTKNKQFIDDSLEQERGRFLQLVRIVETADDCLCLHQTSSMVCNIANICLLVYSVLYYPTTFQDPITACVYLYWLFYSIADICVVCISGILINSSVSVLCRTLCTYCL